MMDNIPNLHLPVLRNDAKVAIIGGSFNPPHLGHTLLASLLHILLTLDEVWILPVADHPFSTKKNVEFRHRLEMCKINFKYDKHFVRILDIEQKLPKPSYTYHTLEILYKLLPNVNLIFAFGSDIIPELVHWEHPEKLSDYASIVIYPREGYPIKDVPPYLQATLIQHSVIPNISSTDLRENFNQLHNLDGRISPEVLNYAKKHHLYIHE